MPRPRKNAPKPNTQELSLVPVEEQPYPLPEGWKWVRLGSIADILNGFMFKSEKYVTEGIRIIRISNVQDGFLEDDKPVFYPLSEHQEIEKFMLSPYDLLISLTGNVGRTAIICNNLLPAAVNQRVLRVRIKNRTLLNYIFYFTQRKQFQNECIANSKGSAQLNLSSSYINSLAIPVPPLDVQERIVTHIESLFAKLDEAKEKAEAVLDSYETRKAAILHKAFTGELIGKKDVTPTSLESILNTIRIGPFGSALHEEDYIDDGIPVINPKHIVKQRIQAQRKVSITSQKAEELASYRLAENDIILGRRGEMGRCAPVTAQEAGWLCGTGSMILRPKPGFSAKFYSLIISSQASVQYLETNAVGTTLKNLNEKIVRKLPIPEFTAEEQKQLTRILDSLLEKEQQSKEAAETVLEQIDLMKKAILAKAFRGELG